MIDEATLLTYMAIPPGFMLIPGPAVLLTLARAGTSGARVGMATTIVVAICAGGGGRLLQQNPDVLRWH